MTDLLHQAFFAVNIPLTILLILAFGYWTLVCFGIFDWDGGGDADAGDISTADASDADVSTEAATGPLGTTLKFINVGEVPVTIVLSVFILSMWVIGVLSNHFLNNGSVLIGLILLAPNFVASLVLTRFVTMPLKRVFRALQHEREEHETLIGKTCVVTTREAGSSHGQGEVTTDGAPVLLQIRTKDGSVLARGDHALIISRDDNTLFHTVVKISNDKLEE